MNAFEEKVQISIRTLAARKSACECSTAVSAKKVRMSFSNCQNNVNKTLNEKEKVYPKSSKVDGDKNQVRIHSE